MILLLPGLAVLAMALLVAVRPHALLVWLRWWPGAAVISAGGLGALLLVAATVEGPGDTLARAWLLAGDPGATLFGVLPEQTESLMTRMLVMRLGALSVVGLLMLHTVLVVRQEVNPETKVAAVQALASRQWRMVAWCVLGFVMAGGVLALAVLGATLAPLKPSDGALVIRAVLGSLVAGGVGLSLALLIGIPAGVALGRWRGVWGGRVHDTIALLVRLPGSILALAAVLIAVPWWPRHAEADLVLVGVVMAFRLGPLVAVRAARTAVSAPQKLERLAVTLGGRPEQILGLAILPAVWTRIRHDVPDLGARSLLEAALAAMVLGALDPSMRGALLVDVAAGLPGHVGPSMAAMTASLVVTLTLVGGLRFLGWRLRQP